MVLALDQDNLDAQIQDVVVIVEPTSQHGGHADVVTIITTVVVEDRVVTLSERQFVEEEEGQFHLQFNVPVRGTDMQKGVPWSAVVLLPRNTGAYEVQLDGAGGDLDGRVLTESDEPRSIVLWHGEQDPLLDVLWTYVRL